MKSLCKMIAIAAMLFANRVLACLAEFGEQQTYPAFKAGDDLTNHQYLVMRLSAINTVKVASNAVAGAATEMAIGVLQNNPGTDEGASVAYQGLSKVVGGAAITAGAMITHNGSGRAIAATSGSTVIGRALNTIANDGEIVTAMLFPPVRNLGTVA